MGTPVRRDGAGWGRKAARGAAALVVLAGLLANSGCASRCNRLFGGPDIVVPEYPTAEEQARSAERQYEVARQSVDEDARMDEFEEAVAALQAVIERFPNDRVYTPPAHALLGEAYLELQCHGNAERTFRTVIEEYPDIADVHAPALYGLAQSLKAQGRTREEKDVLRQLIDIYETSDQQTIRSVVRLARINYGLIERN